MLDAIVDPKEAYQQSDLRIIERSGRFDKKWYCAAHPDIAAAGVDPLLHYVQYGAAEGRNPTPDFDTKRYTSRRHDDIAEFENPFAHFLTRGSEDDLFDHGLQTNFTPESIRKGTERLGRLPIFSADDYLQTNPSLRTAQIGALDHAFRYGLRGGRQILNSATTAKVLGRLARTPASRREAANCTRHAVGRVAVLHNSHGNTFLGDIADDLSNALSQSGIESCVKDESVSADEPFAHRIIVGPHEFFQLGKGQQHLTDGLISSSIMFNTEQPQTLWFERGLSYILMAKAVIDISDQVAEVFRASGIPALFFTPTSIGGGRTLEVSDLDHPLMRGLPEHLRSPARNKRFAERAIDVAFFGGSSCHRDIFFARHARFLSDLECFLYYRKFDGPMGQSQRDGPLTRISNHIASHAKIFLNIHRDDMGFFEWHRIVRIAMAQGSVVVSEPCLPHPDYKPGVHYFEETGRHIPNLLQWLLKTKDGQAAAERARKASRATIRNTKLQVEGAARLSNFLDSL